VRVDELLGLLQEISDAGGGEDEITDDYLIDPYEDAGSALIKVTHVPRSSIVMLQCDQ
jgi:hypothetical protein